MKAALAFLFWILACGLAGADTCALSAWGAPSLALTVHGVARGPATQQEIDSQTAIAIQRAHAPLSPKYAKLPRAFAYFEIAGVRHGTIAAVLDGVMPKPGEAVTLVERHRDPDAPCAFVPWTILHGAPTSSLPAPEDLAGTVHVPIVRRGNGYFVPVTLNGRVTLDFEIDSGASVLTLPPKVIALLQRGGTLGRGDVIGQGVFITADGSRHRQSVLKLHSVSVGGKTLLNVAAAAGPPGSPLLLGQTFLSRFQSWSIDNARSSLVLN